MFAAPAVCVLMFLPRQRGPVLGWFRRICPPAPDVRAGRGLTPAGNTAEFRYAIPRE